MKLQRNWCNVVVGVIGGVLAVVVLCVLVYSWIEYRQFLAEQERNRELVIAANDSPEQRQQAEGKDESEDAGALERYVAAATDPRAIFISKLDIKARTLPMSVNPDGSMQAPINIFDAGWYTGAARPGQKGATVVVAHASGPTRQGLFAYIDTLSVGDTVEIERGDSNILKYRVIEKKTVPLDEVDMNEMTTPRRGDEGLNLMTCGGLWDSQKKTYNQRIMIFTERVQ